MLGLTADALNQSAQVRFERDRSKTFFAGLREQCLGTSFEGTTFKVTQEPAHIEEVALVI